MSLKQRIGPFKSSGSRRVSASANYIGCWPGTKYINPAGTLIAPSITLAVAGISANAIGDTSAPAAGTQSWISAGKRVRVRNTGTIPTGLVATTIYYLGRPSATTVSFHTTLADAAAGTNLVAMTGGTANIVIYEATVADVSGNGRDLSIGGVNNDSTWFATPPYLSGASNGSSDTCAGILDISSLGAALAFPSNSFLMAARIIGGTPVAGRSLWGCGVSGSADGPRLNVDSTDTTKLLAQFYHSGGTNINLGTTAAAAFSSATPHHIALAVDGPRRLAHMWIDGERDLNVYNKSLGAVGTVTWPANLRWGGAAANNCQASSWSDMHMLSFDGVLPSNVDDIVALLATSRYYRLTDGDI